MALFIISIIMYDILFLHLEAYSVRPFSAVYPSDETL